jgi:hypothetical protein
LIGLIYDNKIKFWDSKLIAELSDIEDENDIVDSKVFENL